MSNVDFATLAEHDELDLEDILAIEQAGSEKGIYQRDLLDFVHSGKLGVPYKFQGKNAASVKTGFTSAVDAIQKREDISAEDKEAVKHVEVRVRKVKATEEGKEDQEFVFLINNAVVQAKRGGTEGNAQAPQEAEPAAA